MNTLSSFKEDGVCPIECAFHHLFRRTGWGDILEYGLETQHQSLESLQECIVQLSRYPFAFFHPGRKLILNTAGDFIQVQPIEHPQNAPGREETNDAEPLRLIDGRSNGKGNGRSSFIPESIIVRGDYVKLVGARRKIRIESLPPGSCVLPILVMPDEPVSKAHFLRCDKAQCRVVDLEIPGVFRQPYRIFR